MAILIKEYNLKVYNDGTTVLVEVPIGDINRLLEDCSVKIKQGVGVILHTKVLREERVKAGLPVDYTEIYSKATAYVAECLEVNVSSVRDKLERQLSLTAAGIRSLIEDYIENGSQGLEKVLLQSVRGTQKERQDKLVIEAFFK